MTTVLIDNSSEEARKIIEFLKSVKYAKVIEDRKLNLETIEAISRVEEGEVTEYGSVSELMKALKKGDNVQDQDH
ncbi:MAG: hypothetical protein K9H13_12375 [Bacteroidales bacterium]|nr:hypothetical protein [Bacteroidales bacterium]MCF8345424.1 hypothetical protein [Bacteroidales bacterium]